MQTRRGAAYATVTDLIGMVASKEITRGRVKLAQCVATVGELRRELG